MVRPFLLLLLLGLAFPASSALCQQSPVKIPFSDPIESELMPVVTADGSHLYFTRTRLGLDNEQVFDIWTSDIGADSFGRPTVIGGGLSSRYGIAVTSVSPDNNTLYVIGKLSEDTPPDQRIFVSNRTVEGWSTPEPIRIEGLNARGVYTDYAFGPNQQTLIMAVERDSSMGDRDLYVSFISDNKKSWSTPIWLGSDINSEFVEMTPFLAADGRTLFFSSNRPGGYGEVDVYRAVRLDDSWHRWSIPENLGKSVNRPGRTTFYTESAQGDYAFFSWRLRPQDQTDLYRLPLEGKRRNVALVRGRVVDQNGQPLLARIMYQRLSDGKELGTARSNPVDGSFRLTLPAGERYALLASQTGYVATSDNIDLTQLKEFASIEKNLSLTKLSLGATVRLNNIFFDPDKAILLPQSMPELERLKQLLDDEPSLKISIEGHTDNTGTTQRNNELSKARAEAVRSYLVTRGIDTKRLRVAGFGSEKPVTTNETEEGRATNRRVEFRVVE